jgi:hypothetical protein
VKLLDRAAESGNDPLPEWRLANRGRKSVKTTIASLAHPKERARSPRSDLLDGHQMTVALRKPQPSPPSATSRIEAARLALEESNRKLAELNERRNQCLLKDDNAGAVELGIELANLRLTTRAHEDKIALLREAAAREEQERRAQEKEAQIGKIEKLLAGRDVAGRELADAVAAADRAFRKVIDIGVEAQAEWNWPPSDIPACLLSHAAISHALQAEMYRIGGRPMLGGGQVEAPHAGIHFPGARVPRHELVNLQEKIVPLTAVLQEATAHASNIMRGKRLDTEVDVAVSAPATNGNAGTVPVSNDQGESPSRTPARERLGVLLKQQAELAEDPTREAEYRDVIAALTQAQDEVTAEQKVGAQQHG